MECLTQSLVLYDLPHTVACVCMRVRVCKLSVLSLSMLLNVAATVLVV